MRFKTGLRRAIVVVLTIGIVNIMFFQLSSAVKAAEGMASENVGMHNYSSNCYARVIRSYLISNGNEWMRVEAIGDNLRIEYYSQGYELRNSKTIALELPIFGGFYNGKDAYYVMCGQENPKESDAVEVIRVIKYDKSWKRIGSVSYKGINTESPFAFGSSSFVEYGNCLYVRTCHRIYKLPDGLNHQTNMTLVIDTDTMHALKTYSSVSASAGGTSHSFNQYIRVINNHLVSVDHGDAYPRALAFYDYGSMDGINLDKSKLIPIVSFDGRTGDNYTGATIGGFDASSNSYLFALSKESGRQDGVIDAISLFLLPIGSTNNADVREIKLVDGGQPIGTPFLVKINQNRFVMMWEEVQGNNASSSGKIHAVLVDGNGTMLSKIQSFDGVLSDCCPVYSSGKLVWYVTGRGDNQGTTPPVFCEMVVSGNRLSMSNSYVPVKSVDFDVSFYQFAGDKQQLTLSYEPANATNVSVKWSSSDERVARVDRNGVLNPIHGGTAKITVEVGGKSCTKLIMVQGNSSSAATEAFVSRLYEVALNREPDPAGLADWTNRLTSGEAQAVNIVQGIMCSPEYLNKGKSNGEIVNDCYKAMLGRDADEGGYNDWVTKLDNGMTVEAIFAGFVGSQEFTNLCNSYGIQPGTYAVTDPRDQNQGVTAYVSRLYTQALGRGYDPAGLSDWCGRILANPSRENIVDVAATGFFHSQEFQNKGLNNEEYVKVLYRTFLGRECDPNGLADWVGQLDRGEKTRDEILPGFANSQEFSNIMAQYGL